MNPYIERANRLPNLPDALLGQLAIAYELGRLANILDPVTDDTRYELAEPEAEVEADRATLAQARQEMRW